MKPALQALLIAPDHQMRVDILNGVKAISIIENHCDYKPGPVILCCHLVPWSVMAEITSVRHCLLKEVTKEEYEDNDFHSQEGLLSGLRRFYKGITSDSPVTVIRWKNVQGFLGEKVNRLQYRLSPQELYARIKHKN